MHALTDSCETGKLSYSRLISVNMLFRVDSELLCCFKDKSQLQDLPKETLR